MRQWTTVTSGPVRLREGLSGATLARGGFLEVSWGARAVQGGGGTRCEGSSFSEGPHLGGFRPWGQDPQRSRQPRKEACPVSGPRVPPPSPGLQMLCDPGPNPSGSEPFPHGTIPDQMLQPSATADRPVSRSQTSGSAELTEHLRFQGRRLRSLVPNSTAQGQRGIVSATDSNVQAKSHTCTRQGNEVER